MGKQYWGRFKIGGEWGIWHLIGTFERWDDAARKFVKNTTFDIFDKFPAPKRSKDGRQFEVTSIKPARYAGRYGVQFVPKRSKR